MYIEYIYCCSINTRQTLNLVCLFKPLVYCVLSSWVYNFNVLSAFFIFSELWAKLKFCPWFLCFQRKYTLFWAFPYYFPMQNLNEKNKNKNYTPMKVLSFFVMKKKYLGQLCQYFVNLGLLESLVWINHNPRILLVLTNRKSGN